MGGTASLLMPVKPRYIASWHSHTLRRPKSTEPGTDMFVPEGTPVYAPADGRIYGYGTSIAPMTGRWNGIDFTNGMRFRSMHHADLVRTSGLVEAGELIAYSGASGYGHENWSRLPGMPDEHSHVTLWPTHVSRYGYDAQGRPFTVDFMNFVAKPAGGGSTPVIPPLPEEAIDMDLKLYMITDNGVTTYALAGPKFWWEFTNADRIANRLAGLYNRTTVEVTGTETAINLTYTEWGTLKAACSR